MSASESRITFVIAVLVASSHAPHVVAQGGPSNVPPTVRIEWPTPPDTYFGNGMAFKIKADAWDSDGTISRVEFYADTNLVDVATNPPFTGMWRMESHRDPQIWWWDLKAVATDDSGAKTESRSIRVTYCTGCPAWGILHIMSPVNGLLFPAPATFTFSAERRLEQAYIRSNVRREGR